MSANPTEITRLTRMMSTAARRFQTVLDAHLKPHDLTSAQFGVLDHLVSRPPGPAARLSEIARDLGLGQPAVTKIVAKFARAGLVSVKVGASDARERRVVPSDTAVDVLVEIRRALAADMSGLFGEMTQEDREALEASLGQLLASLEQTRV